MDIVFPVAPLPIKMEPLVLDVGALVVPYIVAPDPTCMLPPPMPTEVDVDEPTTSSVPVFVAVLGVVP
jgi:hypothetical protein